MLQRSSTSIGRNSTTVGKLLSKFGTFLQNRSRFEFQVNVLNHILTLTSTDDIVVNQRKRKFMVRMGRGATGAKFKKRVRAARATDILGVPLGTVKTLFQVRGRVD